MGCPPSLPAGWYLREVSGAAPGLDTGKHGKVVPAGIPLVHCPQLQCPAVDKAMCVP